LRKYSDEPGQYEGGVRTGEHADCDYADEYRRDQRRIVTRNQVAA